MRPAWCCGSAHRMGRSVGDASRRTARHISAQDLRPPVCADGCVPAVRRGGDSRGPGCLTGAWIEVGAWYPALRLGQAIRPRQVTEHAIVIVGSGMAAATPPRPCARKDSTVRSILSETNPRAVRLSLSKSYLWGEGGLAGFRPWQKIYTGSQGSQRDHAFPDTDGN